MYDLKLFNDQHDYQVKLKQILSFLEKKDKVKINLIFRGRELMFKNQGKKILDRFINDIGDRGQTESAPQMEGRVMFAVIVPVTSKK